MHQTLEFVSTFTSSIMIITSHTASPRHHNICKMQIYTNAAAVVVVVVVQVYLQNS